MRGPANVVEMVMPIIIGTSSRPAADQRPLGFATVGPTIELARGPSFTTGDASGVTPLSAADEDELIKFDRTVFGADRGALLARLLDTRASGYVSRHEGRVTGYLPAARGCSVPALPPRFADVLAG